MIIDDGAGQRIEIQVAWRQRRSGGQMLKGDSWLRVTANVSTPYGGWTSADDEVLMLGEAVDLALWLQAMGQGRPRADGLSFLEPNLRFTRRLDSRPGVVVLRVGMEQEMEPPTAIAEAYGRDETEFFLDFALTAQQVLEAGKSLEDELRAILTSAGSDVANIFAPPTLIPTFSAFWVFVDRSASSREEAMRTVEEYLEWANLPGTIEASEPGKKAEDGWLVQARTDLGVPSHDYGEALYRLLSHVPTPYGLPHIDRPALSVHGWLLCNLFLVPRPQPRTAASGRLAGLRWRCVLANFDYEDPPYLDVRHALAYLAGELDEKGNQIRQSR